MPPLRLGAKLVPQGTTIAALRAFWRLADESGFDHLWVYDHLAGVGNAATVAEPDPAIDLFDGWTLLSAMASETRTTRLGCMVTANTLRHPATLAKIATTVDHLSNGRLEFGIGAGWAEYEHHMLGLDLGTPATA
ncbi:LLM class flavin-dependent oxidoreductase [Catenulispora yoronensis]